MSGAMEEAMRMEELGLNQVPDTYVCAMHIDEEAIKKFIVESADRGYCDYCHRKKKVVSLQDVMEFIMDAVAANYTDPANFMSYASSEGGYLGTVYDSNEILQDDFGLDVTDTNLFNDIYNSLDLNKPWGNEMEYYDTPSDNMLYSWEYFKNVVKHRSRYFFGSVKDLKSERYLSDSNSILEEVGDAVKKFKLIHKLPKGSTLYRCRQHSKGDTTVSTASGMTSPPDEYAVTANRMSPAGISMFYGAFEEDTAVIETLDYTRTDMELYSTVCFVPKRDLNIVDLSELPNIPSPFDQEKRQDRYNISFIRDFVKDLAGPIERDNRIHINYVPTQVITEYFRYPFSDTLHKKQKIDGIIYPSSRNGKKACVLFFDNPESLKELSRVAASLKTFKVSFTKK